MGFKKVNTYQHFGVPHSVAYTAFVISVILLIAPYVDAIDFKLFSIPVFPPDLEKVFKWLGPFLFIVCVLLYGRFWKVSENSEEEADALRQLLNMLFDLGEASRQVTSLQRSGDASIDKAAHDSLKCKLAETRKALGLWRQKNSYLISKTIDAAVERVVDVVRREADRVHDGHFKHPTIVDFDRNGLTNWYALNAATADAENAIIARLKELGRVPQ